MKGREVHIVMIGNYTYSISMGPVFSKVEYASEFVESEMMLPQNEGREFWVESRIIDREILF